MLKIQTKYGDEWVYRTRAGSSISESLVVLKGYRRDYPSETHRLVDAHEDGSVTVIPETVGTGV